MRTQGASALTLVGVLVGALAILAGCVAPADDDAESTQDQTASFARCPTTDPTVIDAMSRIAETAERCVDAPEPPTTAGRGFHIPRILSLPRHRGRDAFYAEGDRQWVLGKFSYAGIDLTGEAVELWLLRGCAGQWEKLATVTTTDEGTHPTVEGVDDDGGRVYFEIPASKKLAIGRHRVRMVVVGDGTAADQYIEVLPRGSALVVSDVDGTLTERRSNDLPVVCDEESDLLANLRIPADQPQLHEGAGTALSMLANAGYRFLYLTARPEFLTGHTRDFLRERNRHDGRGDLPQGLVHTTLTTTGALNSAAEAFKRAELAALLAKGFVVTFAFGNRASDVSTYEASNVPFRYFYENPNVMRSCSQVRDVAELPRPFDRPRAGEWRMKSYRDLEEGFGALPRICR